jgi:hypothetical protein
LTKRARSLAELHATKFRRRFEGADWNRLDWKGAKRVQIRCCAKRGIGARLQGREIDVLDHLAYDQPFGGDIDDGEVGIDPAHDGSGGQRVSALPTDARGAEPIASDLAKHEAPWDFFLFSASG